MEIDGDSDLSTEPADADRFPGAAPPKRPPQGGTGKSVLPGRETVRSETKNV
jgi:hypothetical protein